MPYLKEIVSVHAIEENFVSYPVHFIQITGYRTDSDDLFLVKLIKDRDGEWVKYTCKFDVETPHESRPILNTRVRSIASLICIGLRESHSEPFYISQLLRGSFYHMHAKSK